MLSSMPECGVEKVSKRRLKGTRSTKGRIWLASDRDHSKIIDYDRLWRVNAEKLLRQRERRPKAISWLPMAEALRRPIIVVGRNDPVRDVNLPSNALGDGVLGPRLGTLPSLVTT